MRGQPGIESVTKQYLYQLAYKQFIADHRINLVSNCFLMPTENAEIINKGYVSLAMLDALDLKSIQIRFMPAEMMYKHYLDATKIDIGLLGL